MNGFQGPVIVTLKPSRWLPRAVVALHLGALCMLLLAYPPSLPRHLLLVAIAANALWSLRAARSVDIARLELSPRDTWRIVFRDGHAQDARLLRASWVSPLFTTLSLACADGVQRQILLLPDMVEADAFRRLRVRLRRGDGMNGRR